ncbi:unnamed protein product [Coffea canephora]|uniref:G protein gamma domain-containing protein n=1 Tax=Coffea canephora TaxID=49390 RepID=A0A068VF04_COFCA|nr:unnamed protein product [Coffea canephora]
MDMVSASEANNNNNEQNARNPTTTSSSSSSSSPLPAVVVSSSSSSSSLRGGETRHEPRPLSGIGGVGGTHPGFMGKHRMTAAIGYLDQQIQIIQEELDQLDTLGQSSVVCKELITSIESVPDALLPQTKGPVETGWDRWFQGGHGSRNRKKWI